uniref:Uncharacterized protein n=1 Tax=Arundo donax TaxID=35708 RepID=A0A0A8YS86_ARUDO
MSCCKASGNKYYRAPESAMYAFPFPSCSPAMIGSRSCRCRILSIVSFFPLVQIQFSFWEATLLQK